MPMSSARLRAASSKSLSVDDQNSDAAEARARDDMAVRTVDFAPTLTFPMPGSIAFVGINTAGGPDDWLAFVALENIAAGSVIYFTDNELLAAGDASFNAGESYTRWTAPAGGLAAGTIVTITSWDVAGGPVANTGTAAAVTFSGSSNRGFSQTADSVYAYTAASDATVNTPVQYLSLIGIGNAQDGVAPSALPAGNQLIFTSGQDGAVYSGARTGQPTLLDYATLIDNPANWTLTTGATLITSLSTSPFSAGGASETIEFAAASTAVSRIEPDSGTVTFTFTVTRSGTTSGTTTVNGTIAAGTTDAADFGGTFPTSFTVTIADGATTGSFTVTVSGDDTIEADEAFTLTITTAGNSNATPVGIGTASVSTATIRNDDAGATIGGITVFDEAPSLTGAATTPTATDDVLLVRLGSFTGTGATAAGRSESIAYDSVTDRIFTTNAAQGAIDVTQLNADGSTTALASISLSALPQFGTINSVAISGGVIAVAFDNVTAGQPGFVALYDTATTTLQATVQVGVLPDDIVFTPDGQRLLVANEAEAVSAANNPAGSISIISLAGGAAAASVVQTIGFGALTGFETELSVRGVATIASQAAGNDIEPEYVTVSPDGTRAYVVLQEVNAVAVIDLTNTTATTPLAILPLGGVDRNLAGNAFDPSDTGATISIANFDAIGLLQPDAIASYSVGGFTYFVTANEGDSRVGGIADSVRLNSASYVLDPTAYPNAAALRADAVLGRLNVLTNIGDTDGDGDFDQIYTLGGRSLSIYRQNADGSFTKVRETGGEFEAIIARNNPTLFNVNQTLGPIDARSDDKGPEPEGVSIGQVGSRIYAFVSLERVGGVMVYDVTDPANAFYVGFRAPTGSDFGPETSVFVSAAESPTGGALLLTANEISGTTTVYRVVPQTEADDLIEGSAGDDALTGRSGNDVIRGLGGNDSLVGGNGNDTLDGGTGANELQGGTGDDIYVVTNAADTVIEAADAGTDTVQSTAAAGVLSANVENLTFTNDISHTGVGNGLDNVITGGTAFDALAGGDGNDRIIGGSGAANELVGGTGNDVYVLAATGDTIVEAAGEGADAVETVLAVYALAANVENLTFTGTGSFVGLGNDENNFITGGAGRDSIAGGAGNDTIFGGAGAADELVGGTGNDNYVIEAQGTSIVEAAGEGTDLVRTTLDVYVLGDNIEDLDYLGSGSFSGVGNALANQIVGGAGSDTLNGNEGADVLVGNAGSDLLLGGAGADNFIYGGTEGASFDRIIDFTSGSDRILLANSGFTQTGTLTFESGAGAAAMTANSTFLYDTDTGIVSYDADGNGAGAAVQLAQLNTGLTLTVSDFAFF